MNSEAAEKQVEELMPRISLTVIVWATIIGFALALTINTELETFNKILIAGAMLAMSVVTLLEARFIVLPALARDASKPRANLFTVGYAQAMFPGVVALLVPIFVNEWWVALAGGVLGVVFWLVVRDYLGRLPMSRGQVQP